MSRWLHALIFSLLLGAEAIAAQQATGSSSLPCRYHVTIIQAPECPWPIEHPPPTVATGINERGAVCGHYLQCEDPVQHEAFVWTPERGLITLPRPRGVRSADAADINNVGVIVGTYQRDGVGYRGFVYDHGPWTELSPHPDGAWSFASAINNKGVVAGSRSVGSPENPIGPYQAFAWHNGVFSDIPPTYGTFSLANAISDSGEVVGWMGISGPGFDSHSFLWSQRSVTDLGLVRGSISTEPIAINNRRQVVINALFPTRDPYISYVWEEGHLTTVPVLPGFVFSLPSDINDAGTVVGSCQGFTPNFRRAFILQGGVVLNLNDLIDPALHLPLGIGLNINSAEAINNSGQIAATATLHGNAVAVLLTPTEPSDFDCDGLTDIHDLAVLLSQWGRHDSVADLNADGIVNSIDLGILLSNWTLE